MVDVDSKEIRSFNMSRIKSHGTKPELLIRQFLFNNGFRFRLHDKSLPGKQDIVLKKYNTVIFVNAVIGMVIQTVNILSFPPQIHSFGLKKLTQTSKTTKKTTQYLMIWHIILL